MNLPLLQYLSPPDVKTYRKCSLEPNIWVILRKWRNTCRHPSEGRTRKTILISMFLRQLWQQLYICHAQNFLGIKVMIHNGFLLLKRCANKQKRSVLCWFSIIQCPRKLMQRIKFVIMKVKRCCKDIQLKVGMNIFENHKPIFDWQP